MSSETFESHHRDKNYELSVLTQPATNDSKVRKFPALKLIVVVEMNIIQQHLCRTAVDCPPAHTRTREWCVVVVRGGKNLSKA